MRYFLIILLLCCFMACKNDTLPQKEPSQPTEVENFMKNFNKDAALEELEQIDLVLERYRWPVIETGTGLRYWIYEKGNGRMIQRGDKIICDYSLKLLNGNEIYNSQNDDLLTFEVGTGNVAPGLAEAVLLLHEGDKAKIIIPSNLGYGLAGDGNKIPNRATLIYDLQGIMIIKNTK